MDQRVRAADVILICLVVVGVFATFSRAGILAGLLLLFFAIVLRSRRKRALRLVLGGVAISLLIGTFGYFVVGHLQLSEDAEMRVLSLIHEGGLGDYGEDRGATARASLDLAMESPFEGAGVRTIYEMGEGPHNMFIAMMVDYGILGLVAYLAIIIRLTLTARRAPRRSSALIMAVVCWLVIFSFTSHNLFDDSATIPLLGFAIARAWQIRRERLPMRVVEQGFPDRRAPCEY
jgi:O-antigen ligase